MNKNAILFLGFVVVCVVVVIVINFAINSPEQEAVKPDRGKAAQSVSTHQHVSHTQAPAPVPEDEQKAQPVYEATVSNGTILF